jgi:methionine-gamma-lyase
MVASACPALGCAVDRVITLYWDGDGILLAKPASSERTTRKGIMNDGRGLGTRCIHAGEAPDPTTGAHGVPLYQNVTYAFETHAQVEDMRSGARPHFTYSPRANPTVRCLEAKLANLEGTETSVALNSGMAAISGTLLTVLAGGGHVVASGELYDQTRTYLADELPCFGASATFVDISSSSAITGAITAQTRAIYAEPFSNPNLRVADLRMLAEVARQHGLVLIVDNTFLSPALLRPAEFGVDLVIHSATKYLSGNGQVQGGIVSGPRRLVDPIRARALLHGSALSPFAAWVLLAGIHTLPLRMERHSENAMRLAAVLAEHPAIDRVNYPGLKGDPGHAVATSMLGHEDTCFGGMISVALAGGRGAFTPFLNALQLCTIAVSLGDSSTLVWPWHEGNLVRISTGLEDFDDLARDLLGALDVCVPVAVAD